jgi:hypothetical protein
VKHSNFSTHQLIQSATSFTNGDAHGRSWPDPPETPAQAIGGLSYASRSKPARSRTTRPCPFTPIWLSKGFWSSSRLSGPSTDLKQPLFNTGKVGKGRGPAERAREDLAPCDLGVTDKRIQPNHAWRHTWKRRAARARIEAGIRDAVCGHAPRTVADYYEQPTVEDMANALKHFPRYEVAQDLEKH